MLNTIETKKLEMWEKQFGKISAAEALQSALECEETCKILEPFDQAFPHFKGNQIAYEKYAELLEKQNN